MPKDTSSLSRLDRYFMSNQLRILEALYPDEADSYAVRREAIENGYEMLYNWDMDYIYDGQDIMSPDESKEVWDTMDMFDAINRAVKDLELGTNDLKQKTFTLFRGYDGNNETKFMAFAAFTVERLKRFEYLPMAKKGYWNSHMPMRDIYIRMLNVWKKIPLERRFAISRNELNAILDAVAHPDNQ